METLTKFVFVPLFALVMTHSLQEANGAFHAKTQELISRANMNGPYLGLVIPNLFEMNPLLQSPSFKPSDLIIDFQGDFDLERLEASHFGHDWIGNGVTTQLLLSLFEVTGVVHYGIAGNANPALHIGDVAIPQYWAHTALWSWQRNGAGPEDQLPLEENGDYTREIGYIKFANYATNITNCPSNDNLLNNVWYQPEEVFFRDGVPEEREHAFWVPVDTHYFRLAKKLEGMVLEGCVNSTTCLTEKPKVTRVHRGTSASIYLDNAAYRASIFGKFNVSPVDMESAAVALICLQQRTPFIIFRALSDLAGGGSADSNEAATFISLAANNSVAVVLEFIKNLPTKRISTA